MDRELNGFAQRYAAALKEYLKQGGERQLNAAYELGRDALNERIGLLDLADMHGRSVGALLDKEPAKRANADIKAASRFFTEVLSPFEMLHRGHQEANAALRCLNQMLEEEAKRIAHALHDEAGQLLATVYLELAELQRTAPPLVLTHAERISRHLDQVRGQLRRLSHELRPLILDELGIAPALEFLAAGFRQRTNLTIVIKTTMTNRFAPDIETGIYRAVQEALTNVSKHARATQVEIRLWAAHGTLHCTIRDDGVGFDPAHRANPSRGLGLVGIQERIRATGGAVAVTAAPGKGTELHITIPERLKEAST